MDIRQTLLWSSYLQEMGWRVERLSSGFAYSKKLPFFGSTIKIPRAKLPIDFARIETLAKNQSAFMIKVEPDVKTLDSKLINQFKDLGFSIDNWTLSPSKTIQIDLTKSEEELLRALEKDTRYNIRLAEKKGVIVKQTDDFEEFKTLYFDTAKRKGFWPAKTELETLWKVFSDKKSAAILTAYFNDEPLASALLISSEKIGQYQHAASSENHREVMAPYLLLWESIRFLKGKGCKIFDLEGLYDPRYKSTKNWRGFSLFKKGFGGEEIEYIGSFVKYPKWWSKLLFLLGKVF